MSISFSVPGVALAVLMAAAASAPLAAEPLTLGEAQRIAVGRSQQLVAQDALTTAAREQAAAAGQLPDPVLKLGLDNLPANGPDRLSLTRDFMTMRRVGVMQEIPRMEKRRLKSERFERDALRVQAQRQLTLANVQRDTALAWLDRYYSLSMRDLIQQQVEETRLQTEAANVAFRTGRGSQADVFAARAAAIILQDRISQIDQQARGATLMLARWVGPPAAARPPTGMPSWRSPPLQEGSSEQQIRQHPELQAMAAEVEALETDARLAQANKQADWSVEASYAQRGPAYSNMVSIGVSIPLQWDRKNRQDREVAARLALVDEARARYEDMLRIREAEVRSMFNDWQTGMERVARYHNELIPATKQRAEAALTTYRTGQSDLASALSARQGEIDVRLQALSLEAETARAWARLNFLIPDQSTAFATKETP